MPIFWAIDLELQDGYLGLALAGDYYLIDSQLIPTLHWYLGVGGFVGLGFSDNSMDLRLGARLPIGLSWQPIPLLEIFLQVVPSLGVSVIPFYFPYGGWGGNLGIRLWF